MAKVSSPEQTLETLLKLLRKRYNHKIPDSTTKLNERDLFIMQGEENVIQFVEDLAQRGTLDVPLTDL